MFDGNWCKLIFFSLSSTHLIVLLISYSWGHTVIPTFLLKTIRYGKLICNDKARNQITDISKSHMRHYYLLAAFIYAPVALYQVFATYFLEREISGWFIGLLNTCCGSNRSVVASATHTTVAILLMSLQIWRRFYDIHFVSVFSKSAKMTLSHYVLGLMFYMGALLVILSEGPKFANRSLDVNKNVDVSEFGKIDTISVAVFLWAWYHQYTTTVILANLRKNKNGNVITEGYKIPEGDLFKYLSSPHVTTEILMYTCIWIILGFRHSWWCVYLMVLYNQTDSIISSHKWYQNQFKNFPKERKALIPFIY